MEDKNHTPSGQIHDDIIQIRVRGHLSHEWAEWFEGLTITLEAKGNTLLTGPVVDQSALHGFLKKIRDLGLPLLSVNRFESNTTDITSGKMH